MSLKRLLNFFEILLEYFSRKKVAKLLVKLPAGFFPNYRIILSPVMVKENRKSRRLTRFEVRLNSDSEESDTGIFHCNCTSTPKEKRTTKDEQNKMLEKNLFATPPLRRITAKELSSVKLRKSVNFPISPRVADARDILGVLKKRFVVMHSPGTYAGHTDSGEISEHSASTNSFYKPNL